jgi:lactoylglutathione lyase
MGGNTCTLPCRGPKKTSHKIATLLPMKKVLPFVLILLSMNSNAQSNKAQLNHIAHYVVDLKVATEFYLNVIGLDTIPEPFHDGKHTWFSVGPKSHLHIIEGATEKQVFPKNHHLCFTVHSVNDFTSKLKSRGIEYENVKGEKNAVTIRVDGVKQIWFRDPDGYWIEINDARE